MGLSSAVLGSSSSCILYMDSATGITFRWCVFYRRGSQKMCTSIISLCDDKNLKLKPEIMHVDFELTVMNVISELFPDMTLKCCLFYLGNACWLKIQKLGLSRNYQVFRTWKVTQLVLWFGISSCG